MELTRSLWQQAREITEQRDGFTFIFDQSPDLHERIAEWISDETKCCPFLSFETEQEPGSLTYKLRVFGPKGAKEVLADEMRVREYRN